MDYGRWLRLLLAGTAFAALVTTAGLPLPGADRLGLGGTAAAQAIDIDYFYDELDPYGEWVFHPRFGYVWLPGNVSENWRPYTVGHWVYTDEYGWYWDSFEPFAWAVYHYGRWGYDPDYGWFWVPGDTWAPAWVQWRYGDNYVGWAPIGPRRQGYAYGLPLDYGPAVAEAWVFVPTRYLTSRTIYRYALAPADLGVAFYGASNVYRPEFRGGVVFNFGMPRDRAARFIGRPIIEQKIYRVDRKGGRYGKFEGGENGIRVFAPGFEKGAKPNRKPRRFVDSPSEFKPKAKLKHTFQGKPPQGWGPGAAEVNPVVKETGPQGFKPKKYGAPGNDDDQSQGNEATGHGGQNATGGQADQGTQDDDNNNGNHKNKNWKKHKGFEPGGQEGSGGEGAGDSSDQGGGRQGTPPGASEEGSQGAPPDDNDGNGQGSGQGNGNKRKAFEQSTRSPEGDQDGQGDHGGKDKKNKKSKEEKCREHPDRPECQN